MTKPSSFLIGIVIFTLITMSGVAMVSILMSGNPAMANGDVEQFNETFNVYGDITNLTDTLQDNLEDSTSDDTGLTALISGTWQTLRLLGSSLSFMNNAIQGMSAMFYVPGWVTVLIIAVVTIMLVFAIWGAVFQRDL